MPETYVASDIVRVSLITLWSQVAGFVPRFIAAVVVFLIGWLIAVLIAKLAYQVIRILHVDNALTRIGFRRAWERSGFRLDSAYFFYELVKWFFIIVFLMAATNIVGLDGVTEFLRTVVLYVPNVIVAAIVMLIGILVAKLLEGFVLGAVKAAGLMSANFLGAITKWAVLVFSLLVALSQLNVADYVINAAITGLVAALALALGLSFGLGGAKHADEFLSRLKKRIGE